jgi:hypothetical protein
MSDREMTNFRHLFICTIIGHWICSFVILWHHQRMIKHLKSAALVLWAAAATAAVATPAPTTVTNVLQNITVQLTIYQQGLTNPAGTKVADTVTSYTTKSLIAALEAVTGNNFGAGAKLVQSTVYSNETITIGPAVYTTNSSTNLALATNGDVYIGAAFIGLGTNSATIVSNQLTYGGSQVTINSDIVAAALNTNDSVTINTNAGFITTLTPSTNGVAVVGEKQVTAAPTESILTNVSSSIDILYGGAANALYPVTNYLSFSTNLSAEIVVESGAGLDTTNALTVNNLASQTGFSIQGLQINYFTPTGSTNLILDLQGFVKQTLKVDTLYARGTNRIIEDIFGASSTWNVIGSGYAGGTYTTNSTSVPISVGGLVGYLTNASPVVVEGAVSVSFDKNLAQ